MIKPEFLIFPSFVTSMVECGELTIAQLKDIEGWPNIFSGSTVDKIKLLNSLKPGDNEDSDTQMNVLGISWMFNYTTMDAKSSLPITMLQTCMSDGREGEAKYIFEQLHNFDISFKFERTKESNYVILLNDLHNLDSIENRYVTLRSNMGDLIKDMESMVPHERLILSPLLQSYMKL